MSRPVVVADVSQFFRDPYASGIQRVLWGLAANWPINTAECHFVYSGNQRQYRVLTGTAFSSVVAELFATELPRSEWKSFVQDRGRTLSKASLPLKSLIGSADVWLLPEITYDRAILRVMDLAARRVPTSMVFYDAFTETHPGSYAQGPGYSVVSQYSRRAATCASVVSISEYSRDILVNRLRRDIGKTYVAHPGGDHVEPQRSPVPAVPTFAVVSTLEARKRHGEIIAAFRSLARTIPHARLVLAGRKSGTSGPIENAIASGQKDGARITWLPAPTDEEIRRLYQTATAVFSIGDEGYGISVVEAIRQGCPVAFAGTQPAAEVCDTIGARRLAGSSRESIHEFMAAAADQSFAKELRESVSPDAVPKWSKFASGVAEGVLDAGSSKRAL